jgi:hypothetical protein
MAEYRIGTGEDSSQSGGRRTRKLADSVSTQAESFEIAWVVVEVPNYG